ncbi:MAG: hypothetical protein MZV70_28055 [Desulfobacterales bacterium]|nr:hypothetical protein [Desulfobacterales bacterium]
MAASIIMPGIWPISDNGLPLIAVFNQIPADVTHIRLARGEGGEQLDLLGVMGKIKLEVTSTKND